MALDIAGNYSCFNRQSLRKLEKHLNIILAPNQSETDQKILLDVSFRSRMNLTSVLEKLTREEMISFIFILTQFGCISDKHVTRNYLNFEENPLVIEWNAGHYLIPGEILNLISIEKIFRNQNYLLALLYHLPLKEKKAWIKWIAMDFQGETEWDYNKAIYRKCRKLQKPFHGKSHIHDNEFTIDQVWRRGKSEEIDWYYKGLVPLYYALNEVYRVEKDPFFIHVLEVIKAGKFIPKREQDEFLQPEKVKFVASVEGSTPQIRDEIYYWEEESYQSRNSLFSEKIEYGN